MHEPIVPSAGAKLIALRQTQQSTYLRSTWPDGNVVDTPIGMEAPAKRPMSSHLRTKTGLDSLRADEPATLLGTHVQKAGWLWKAVGRPPIRTWREKWVYIVDDRLCWVDEEDIKSPAPTAGHQAKTQPQSPDSAFHRLANAAITSPGQDSNYKIGVSQTVSQQAEGETLAIKVQGSNLRTDHLLAHLTQANSQQVGNIIVEAGQQPAFDPLHVKYIPIDRIPVRPTPRGLIVGTGITIVSDSQIVRSGPIEGKSGVVFAVVAGAHTHFWAAPTAKGANEWVEALKGAWHMCVRHTARSCGYRGPADNLEHHVTALQGENALLNSQVKELTNDKDTMKGALQLDASWCCAYC